MQPRPAASSWLAMAAWQDRGSPLIALALLSKVHLHSGALLDDKRGIVDGARRPGGSTMSKTYLIVFVLIVLSGFGDSLGFVYASRIWQKDALSWVDLGKSVLGWGIGISLYVFALRYMNRAGIASAEIQTAVWFAM